MNSSAFFLSQQMLSSPKNMNQGPQSDRMPQELMQEMFFDCIQSLVKTQISLEKRKVRSRPASSGNYQSMASTAASRNVLQTSKAFERMTEAQKQGVLLDFIQNKAVLRAIYDLMFTDKGIRSSVSPSEGRRPSYFSNRHGVDFNRLLI